MAKQLQGQEAGPGNLHRFGDRGYVSSVLFGVIKASRRFKEDVEAEVQLGEKVEEIRWGWAFCQLCRSDPFVFLMM